MPVTGFWKFEQSLQQPVQMRGGVKILAADHMADALQRVVVNRGEVIACSIVLAGDDRVAEDFGRGFHASDAPAGLFGKR